MADKGLDVDSHLWTTVRLDPARLERGSLRVLKCEHAQHGSRSASLMSLPFIGGSLYQFRSLFLHIRRFEKHDFKMGIVKSL